MDTKRATISEPAAKAEPGHNLLTDLGLKAHKGFLRGWMEDLNSETDLRHHPKWAEEANDV